MINIQKISPIIGIYKVTSPSGKVYIGQAISILRRWNVEYRNLKCKGQPKLYNSLKSHSYGAHKFEILEECSLDKLDEREVYYKQLELDKVKGNWQKVLFCQLIDGKGGHRSEETKSKIRNFRKGMKFSKETCLKMSKPKSKEHILNMSKPKNNKQNFKGVQSEKHKQSLRKPKLNKEGFKKPKIHLQKIILQFSKNDEFIKEWSCKSEILKHYKGDIQACCKGKQKTAAGFKWKYKNG